MRCSSRRPGMHPFTSTPIAIRPSSILHALERIESCLSPIEATSRRRSTLEKKGSLRYPDRVGTMKENSKRQVRASENPRCQSILEEIMNENRPAVRKVSRVEAILEEAVCDSLHKSHAEARLRSDENLNAVIEMAMKNRDIQIQPISKATRKQQPRKKEIEKPVEEDKKNFVRRIVKQGHEVDLLMVRKRKRETLDKTANKKPSFTVRPAQVQQSEIFDLADIEWSAGAIEGTMTSSFSHGSYVKISPKKSLSKVHPINEVYVIILGNAIVEYDEQTSNVGPGSRLEFSTGFKIFNPGRSKDLILLSLN